MIDLQERADIDTGYARFAEGGLYEFSYSKVLEELNQKMLTAQQVVDNQSVPDCWLRYESAFLTYVWALERRVKQLEDYIQHKRNDVQGKL